MKLSVLIEEIEQSTYAMKGTFTLTLSEAHHGWFASCKNKDGDKVWSAHDNNPDLASSSEGFISAGDACYGLLIRLKKEY